MCVCVCVFVSAHMIDDDNEFRFNLEMNHETMK